MNLTLNQYLSGFEEGIERLPGVMDEIEARTLDEELFEEYVDQLGWLIGQRQYVLDRGVREGDGQATRVRIDGINAGLGRLSARLKRVMGIDVPSMEKDAGQNPCEAMAGVEVEAGVGFEPTTFGL